MIPTTNLLRHAIAGALASLVAALGLFPAQAQATAFAGAMSALLEDLDRCEMPYGRRTPFGHSVAALLVWAYVGVMVTTACAFMGAMSQASACAVSIGLALGYTSHLLLDAFSEEGIYLFPNRKFPILEALPSGCRRQWSGWTVKRLGAQSAPVDASEGEPVGQ